MEDNRQETYEDPSDTNIYIYVEEDEDTAEPDDKGDGDLDRSGPNYSQAEMPEESAAVTAKSGDGKNPIPFLLMLKVLFNPVEGWKSIRREGLSPEKTQRDCFNPLLALFAVSKFARLIYSSRVNVAEVIVSAVSSFVAFFFGYFCILMLFRLFMPKDMKATADKDYMKVFVMINLSSLCLFFTMLEILPMLWAFLIFLPLWTVYSICQGTRFFKFPENRKITYTGLLCLLIVGVPCVIDWLLGKILPV